MLLQGNNTQAFNILLSGSAGNLLTVAYRHITDGQNIIQPIKNGSHKDCRYHVVNWYYTLRLTNPISARPGPSNQMIDGSGTEAIDISPAVRTV